MENLEIVALFGTHQEVARILGVERATVSTWCRKRTEIPRRHIATLLAEAKRRNIALKPAHFFPTLYDTVPPAPPPHVEKRVANLLLRVEELERHVGLVAKEKAGSEEPAEGGRAREEAQSPR